MIRTPADKPAGIATALVGLSLWALLQSSLLTAYGYPCPRGDDSVYKSPAVEWALNGKMIIPGMTGALKQADAGFAHYPPIYQYVYGVWYKLFGFSLYTTLTCSHLIHSLSALAVATLIWRILSVQQASIPGQIKTTLSFAAGLFHLGNLAYFDRPEDLALLFLIGLIHFVNSSRFQNWLGLLVAGLLISLAGLTAPWVGVLSGIFLAVFELFSGGHFSKQSQRIFRVFITGVVALGPVLIWVWWMNSSYPQIVQQQLIDGNLSYAESSRPTSITTISILFLQALFFDTPRAICLIGVLLLFLRLSEFPLPQLEKVTLTSGLCGLAVVILLRPTAYTYIGVCVVLLIPTFFIVLMKFLYENGRTVKSGYIVIGMCALIGQFDVLQTASLIVRVPTELTADACYQDILDTIPPGELVGVSPRHWYALQSRNPWRELYFVSTRHDSEIEKCQWIIIYPSLGTPPFIENSDDYALISKRENGNFGRNQTYAYTIWKRKPDEGAD